MQKSILNLKSQIINPNVQSCRQIKPRNLLEYPVYHAYVIPFRGVGGAGRMKFEKEFCERPCHRMQDFSGEGTVFEKFHPDIEIQHIVLDVIRSPAFDGDEPALYNEIVRGDYAVYYFEIV